MSTINSILKEMRRKWICYLFISPFFAMFFMFIMGPVGYSLYLSFFRMRGLRAGPRFVGFTNYLALATDSLFLKALGNTLVYTGVQVSITLCLAIGLALLLNSPLIKFKKVFRLIYFFPVMTSLVIAAFIFRLILEKNAGMANILLSQIGFPKKEWLGNPDLGLTSLILLGIWRQLGFHFIIILAGLQNIPNSVVEAAIVDGASRLKVIWHIILPMIFPVIFFVLITRSIVALQLFAQPYVFGQGTGGPGNSMLTLALYQYLTAFLHFKFGYAATIAYTMVGIIMVFTAVQMKLLGKKAGITG